MIYSMRKFEAWWLTTFARNRPSSRGYCQRKVHRHQAKDSIRAPMSLDRKRIILGYSHAWNLWCMRQAIIIMTKAHHIQRSMLNRMESQPIRWAVSFGQASIPLKSSKHTREVPTKMRTKCSLGVGTVYSDVSIWFLWHVSFLSEILIWSPLAVINCKRDILNWLIFDCKQFANVFIVRF